MNRLPRLPALVEQKLTKTGYTRGAAQKEIYQNRVTRNNPVLIPWNSWDQCRIPDDGSGAYENGFIVLVEPSWYFTAGDADATLADAGLELGVNALLLFRRRADWIAYCPSSGHLPNGKPFVPAHARSTPLGGVYFARIHATVSEGVSQVIEGFASSTVRGAGIRVYEYASSAVIAMARLQLEALIWLCDDAVSEFVAAGMSSDEARSRRDAQLASAERTGLLDLDRLETLRIVDGAHQTICPLCKQRISAGDLFKRSAQAEGRETYDLTTTEISLFHIQELRMGKFQHKPYNLGWGHHFCNVVVKDAGIMPTLRWMAGVIANQGDIDAEAESVEEAVDL